MENESQKVAQLIQNILNQFGYNMRVVQNIQLEKRQPVEAGTNVANKSMADETKTTEEVVTTEEVTTTEEAVETPAEEKTE